MPLAPMNFQITGDPMSENLMKAIQQGMAMGYMPKQMQQQFQGQDLQNQLAAIQLKYAPQTAEADVNYKNAMAAYAGNRLANGANKPLSSAGKLLSDYQNAINTYGADSDQAKQLGAALQNLAAGKNGITVYDQNGNPVVNVGGSAGRGGGGGVTRDAEGNIVARPTTAQMTRLQKIASGEENLDQYFTEAFNNLAQFQDPIQNITEKSQEFSNKYFGTDFKLPSQKAYGESSLKTSAEGLLNIMGITGGEKNVEEMNNILKPRSGESANGYLERGKKQLQKYAEAKLRGLQKMSAGYQVGQGAPGGPQFKNLPMPQTNNQALTVGNQQAAALPGAHVGMVDSSQLTPTQHIPMPSMQDLQFTAQKYGLTVDQVKKQLGIK